MALTNIHVTLLLHRTRLTVIIVIVIIYYFVYIFICFFVFFLSQEKIPGVSKNYKRKFIWNDE